MLRRAFLFTNRLAKGVRRKRRPESILTRRLAVEGLEDRRMLAAIGVNNDLDLANGDTSSIANLIANDGGDGIALREAILAVNNDAGPDTIKFDATIFNTPHTITIGNQLPTITEDVTINGPGAGLLTIDANNGTDNIPGTGDGYRIFHINDGDNSNQIDIAFSGLTLAGGDTSGSGGSVSSFENLTVTSSTISGNSAVGIGSNGGGIYSHDSNLTITSSTISGNSADGGGGIAAVGTTTITSSTISGNSAYGIAGGIAAYVGPGQQLTISHSTITGNMADVDNDLNGNGGGIFALGPGEVSLNHTIIAGNTDNTGIAPDLDLTTNPFGAGATSTFSLIGNNTGSGLAETVVGNLIGGPVGGVIDPLLSPLANNGGPTKTHALAAGSPAVDAGNPAALAGIGGTPDFDQRNDPFGRVFDGNTNGVDRIDIGAHERQNVGAPHVALVVDILADENDGDLSPGDLSLREAIGWANSNAGIADSITFATALDGGTITLTMGDLVINDEVTINASGLPRGITIDASGNDPTPGVDDGLGSRIFNIDDGDFNHQIDVKLSGFALTGGDVADSGGAIRSIENVRITSSTISGNSAGLDGGGIGTAGTTSITSSTVSGNSANGIAGGIAAHGTTTITSSTISGNSANGSAGGIAAYGTTTIAFSTVSGNSADDSVGGIVAYGTTTITSSTISGNTTNGYAGGMGVAGTTTITSSTISGNSAYGNAGGIYAYVGPGHLLTIAHSTITGNISDTDNDLAGSGGGIFAYGPGAVALNHTIIAGNTDNTGIAPDLDLTTNPPGAGTTSTFSLIGNNTGSGLAETVVGNLIGGPVGGIIDPLLSPLANNGGPTKTHALAAVSPAVDAGNPAAVAGIGGTPDFDQRNDPFGRVFDGNGDGVDRIDIGAYERIGTDVPAIGVWSAGTAIIDTNGNFLFDPANPSLPNGDSVYHIGFSADNIFTGKFGTFNGIDASGFDTLAVYGRVGSQWRWLIDLNHDGVPDQEFNEASINGLPVAGNFDGNLTNGDEVGIFTGTTWVFDTNRDFSVDYYISTGNYGGFPIVGDFDGDGDDDVATYVASSKGGNLFSIDLNTAAQGFPINIDGIADYTFQIGSPGFGAGGGFNGFPGVRERPVAADMNADGIDDIGLWVPDGSTFVPGNQGEWYFLITDNDPLTLQPENSVLDRIINSPIGDFVPFTTTPFGNDLFAKFGNSFAVPLVGNFTSLATTGTNSATTVTIGQQITTQTDSSVSTLLSTIAEANKVAASREAIHSTTGGILETFNRVVLGNKNNTAEFQKPSVVPINPESMPLGASVGNSIPGVRSLFKEPKSIFRALNSSSFTSGPAETISKDVTPIVLPESSETSREQSAAHLAPTPMRNALFFQFNNSSPVPLVDNLEPHVTTETKITPIPQWVSTHLLGTTPIANTSSESQSVETLNSIQDVPFQVTEISKEVKPPNDGNAIFYTASFDNIVKAPIDEETNTIALFDTLVYPLKQELVEQLEEIDPVSDSVNNQEIVNTELLLVEQIEHRDNVNSISQVIGNAPSIVVADLKSDDGTVFFDTHLTKGGPVDSASEPLTVAYMNQQKSVDTHQVPEEFLPVSLAEPSTRTGPLGELNSSHDEAAPEQAMDTVGIRHPLRFNVVVPTVSRDIPSNSLISNEIAELPSLPSSISKPSPLDTSHLTKNLFQNPITHSHHVDSAGSGIDFKDEAAVQSKKFLAASRSLHPMFFRIASQPVTTGKTANSEPTESQNLPVAFQLNPEAVQLRDIGAVPGQVEIEDNVSEHASVLHTATRLSEAADSPIQDCNPRKDVSNKLLAISTEQTVAAPISASAPNNFVTETAFAPINHGAKLQFAVGQHTKRAGILSLASTPDLLSLSRNHSKIHEEPLRNQFTYVLDQSSALSTSSHSQKLNKLATLDAAFDSNSAHYRNEVDIELAKTLAWSNQEDSVENENLFDFGRLRMNAGGTGPFIANKDVHPFKA